MRRRQGDGVMNLVLFLAISGMALMLWDLDLGAPSEAEVEALASLRLGGRPTLAVFGAPT